ncbi:MAG: hypothetical protein QXR41_05155 [Nitrososphaerota archaeon]
MSATSIPMEKGIVKGKLVLRCPGKAPFSEIVKMRPDVESLLAEIESKGWRHFYVDHEASLVGEIEFDNVEYQIVPWSILRGPYGMVIDIKWDFPQVTGIELEKLVYNIFTKNTFPRAVTIDVQKKSITYVNDVFWKWEDEWIKEESKKTRAIEIYDLLKWLIEEKEFQLSQEYDADKWRELSEKFEKIKSRETAIP